MEKKNIKIGMKVCILVKGVPFCNTTVTSYPAFGYGASFAEVDGVDEPVRIEDLRSFTTGVIKPAKN